MFAAACAIETHAATKPAVASPTFGNEILAPAGLMTVASCSPTEAYWSRFTIAL